MGVAYLLYMAWNTPRERGALKVEQEVGARSAIQVTVTGILINILNPKLSVFVGYGLFAASIRDHVISRPRVLTWMRRSFAAAFVALSARLALTDR
jgi:threonine/homoserine/homoserine lactone efflux protein